MRSEWFGILCTVLFTVCESQKERRENLSLAEIVVYAL